MITDELDGDVVSIDGCHRKDKHRCIILSLFVVNIGGRWKPFKKTKAWTRPASLLCSSVSEELDSLSKHRLK